MASFHRTSSGKTYSIAEHTSSGMDVKCQHCQHPTCLFIELCDSCRDTSYANCSNHFASSMDTICHVPSHHAEIFRRQSLVIMSPQVTNIRQLIQQRQQKAQNDPNIQFSDDVRKKRTAVRNLRVTIRT